MSLPITHPALRAAERIRQQCEVREVRFGREFAHVWATEKLPRKRAQPKKLEAQAPSAQQIKSEQNRRECIRLREEGLSNSQIAAALQITRSTVWNLVGAHPDERRGRPGGGKPRPLHIEGVRYDSIQHAMAALGMKQRSVYNLIEKRRAFWV